MATRVFISFDYDNDKALKDLLVGQSKHPDSPFSIADWSIKNASTGWKEDARRRIRSSDVMAVICGEHTDTATGVSVEVTIAREEGVPYFLLEGYQSRVCRKPTAALQTDKMYSWTWENLKQLVGGSR